MTLRRKALALLLTFVAAGPLAGHAAAEDIVIAPARDMPPRSPDSPIALALPTLCDVGADCFVQNYVDSDPGPDAKDHYCGGLAYDGHKGVDIRVRTLPEMEAGVPILAAASGVVIATRDAMPDVSFRVIGREAVRGREAGNGVVIDHGNGWQTQYSHMKRGSILVTKGQRVEAGDRLGMIGLSGKTEFPHLHFSVRKDGVHYDPFTGLTLGAGCGRSAGSLWDEAALQRLAYREGGLLAMGFTDRGVKVTETVDGSLADRLPNRDSPALVLYATAWGLQGGDRESLQFFGPDGKLITEADGELPKNKARWFRFIGRKLRDGRWPAGTYSGRYRIERDTASGTVVVVDVTRELELR